jgi:hypothetical protein
MLFEASNWWQYAFGWCVGAGCLVTVIEAVLGTESTYKQFRRYNSIVYIAVQLLVYSIGFLLAS